MSAPLVISYCDLSGTMGEPWAEAGYDVLCIDIQHPFRSERVEHVGRGRIIKRWGDLRTERPVSNRDVHAAFAFIPCTHFAVSGARDFEKKGPRLVADAMELVADAHELVTWYGCLWMIENPVGRLSTMWRKPDHIFDPCDYGDPWTKKTCLWTGGGFVMPPKNRVDPVEGSKMHLMAPGPDRANARSATPPGFAAAVFQANAPRNALLGVSA